MPFQKNIDAFLTQAGITLTNAQQGAEIKAALTVFGYDDARLQAGVDLLAAAQASHAAQKREYGDQYQATAALNEAHQVADAQYKIHRKLVGIVLKDDPQRQKAVGLHKAVKRSLSGWLGQATIFYTNLLADTAALTDLARFNVDQVQIEAAQGKVKQVADLKSSQEREKSEAQAATKSRDAALDTLQDWLDDFGEVASIALADNPQLLEALQLGVVS